MQREVKKTTEDVRHKRRRGKVGNLLKAGTALLLLLVSLLRSTPTAEAATTCTTTDANCTLRCCISLEPRPYDGTNTNPWYPQWGVAGTPLNWSLLGSAAYDGDGTKATGEALPSARKIAQGLYLEGRTFSNALELNQLFPYWALHMYYDTVDLRDNATDPFDIPCDDGVVDYQCPATCTSTSSGATEAISFYRAEYEIAASGKRAAVNKATAFFDMSHIYGLSKDAARALRTLEGGHLNLTTTGLPWRLADGSYLLADQRNAGGLGILALAALLMREHNRKADELAAGIAHGTLGECLPTACDTWEDDELFEAARQWTIAAYQHVIIQEFIPTILGEAPASRWGRRTTRLVDPTVDTFYAAVGSRWMWSAFSPFVRLLDGNWAPLQEYDPLELRHTPDANVTASILNLYGLEPVLRGLMATPAANVDATVTDHLVSYATIEPVTDIQRARDLGVPGYNAARAAYGLPVAASFFDVTSDAKARQLLADLYGSVSDGMDALVGALAEDLATDPVPLDTPTGITTYPPSYFLGSDSSDALAPASSSLSEGEMAAVPAASTLPAVGPLLRGTLLDQFRRLYEGDTLWHMHNNTLEATMDTNLATLIARNPDPDSKTGEASATLTNMPLAGFRVPAFNLTSTNSSDSGDSLATFKSGVYWMKWSAPTDGKVTLIFSIVGMGQQGQGYIGFGVGASMRDGADILHIAFNPDDSLGHANCTATDRHATTNALPALDTDLGYEDDAPVVACSYNGASDAYTVVATRKMDTGDSIDKPIGTGSVDIIWSFNLHARERQHGYDDRGQMQIDFYTGSAVVVSSSQRDFFALHGLIMLIAFGCAAPAAMYVARYMKHKKYWMDLHETLGVFTAQASIPIAAAAIASSSMPRFVTVHGKLGLAMLILVMLQTATGYLRMLGISNRGNKIFGDNYSRVHWLNARVHRYLGRCVVPLGLLQVLLGLERISPSSQAQLVFSGIGQGTTVGGFNVSLFKPIRNYVYWIWLALLVVVFAWFELQWLRRKAAAQSKLEQRGRLPHFTQEEFNDRLMQGAKWVIVNDQIIDVSEYMRVHPGGSKIVKMNIGNDVTAEMAGKRPVGKGVFTATSHAHSAAAYAAMTVVGYILKHNFYTDDSDLPDRRIFSGRGAGSGVGTGSDGTASADSSSTSLRRGLGFGPRFMRFEVVRKAAVPDDRTAAKAERPIYLFTLAPKDCNFKIDAVRPGFYFKLRVMSRGTMIQRQYTPVGTRALEDGRVGYDFYVRLLPGGQMSEFLRSAKAGALRSVVNSGLVGAAVASVSAGGSSGGSVVGVQGPFVIAELGEQYEHIYMLAGGTGVTPMLQVARYHVRAMLARCPPETVGGEEEVKLEGGDGNSGIDGINNSSGIGGGDDGSGDGSGGSCGRRSSGNIFSLGIPPPSTAGDVSTLEAAVLPHAATVAPAVLPAPASLPARLAPTPRWSALRGSIAAGAALRGKRPSRGRAEQNRWPRDAARADAAESRFLAADGGATVATAPASFRPAATLELLWQARDAADGFCLAGLDDLAACGRGAFLYTLFAKTADTEELRGFRGRPRRRGSSGTAAAGGGMNAVPDAGAGTSRQSFFAGHRSSGSLRDGGSSRHRGSGSLDAGASRHGSGFKRSGSMHRRGSVREVGHPVMSRSRSSATIGGGDDGGNVSGGSVHDGGGSGSSVRGRNRGGGSVRAIGSDGEGKSSNASTVQLLLAEPEQPLPDLSRMITAPLGIPVYDGTHVVGLPDDDMDLEVGSLAGDSASDSGGTSCDDPDGGGGTSGDGSSTGTPGGARSGSDGGGGSTASRARGGFVRNLAVGVVNKAAVSAMLQPLLDALAAQQDALAAQQAALGGADTAALTVSSLLAEPTFSAAAAAAAAPDTGVPGVIVGGGGVQLAAADGTARDGASSSAAMVGERQGDATDLASLLGSTVVVVSGPTAFADGMVDILRTLKVPDHMILCLD